MQEIANTTINDARLAPTLKSEIGNIEKTAQTNCTPFPGGAGSPFSTMSPGRRPTSVQGGIHFHPAVWPQ